VPGKYLDYYTRVADRILPFLAGRQIAVEQRFPGSDDLVYRRHTGGSGEDTWIRIADREALLEWARKYVVGIHAHVRSEDRGAWFVIDIDSRELPTEMARLAAEHAAEVLAGQGLAPLVKFSGADGFHLMWDVPDLAGTSDAELWELERAVVRAVACEVARRLEADPRAAPVREAVGADKPFITTANADRDNPHALLFDEYILKDNANFRVPYSIHPRSGLVAAPLTREQLRTFRPEAATPAAVSAEWPEVALPSYPIAAVKAALDAWSEDGCA
jgi:DNA primase